MTSHETPTILGCGSQCQCWWIFPQLDLWNLGASFWGGQQVLSHAFMFFAEVDVRQVNFFCLFWYIAWNNHDAADRNRLSHHFGWSYDELCMRSTAAVLCCKLVYLVATWLPSGWMGLSPVPSSQFLTDVQNHMDCKRHSQFRVKLGETLKVAISIMKQSKRNTRRHHLQGRT